MKPAAVNAGTIVSATGGGGGTERDQLKNAKISVLKLINENREILFEKTSDMLTKEMKEAKWAEVANRAHELGAIPWHRNWDYLKDTTWQNWRKRFVEKREKKEKFENMGVTTKILYDEADLLIMDILDSLGKGSSSSFPQTSISSVNSLSYSIPSTTPSVGSSQLRDIAVSDLLEIEFDIKNEEDFEDEDDVVDGPPGSHIEISEEEDVGAAEFQNVYGNGNNSGFQSQNGHQSYHQQLDNCTNGDNNVSREGEDITLQPKIVNTSSLSSPASRAFYLRKCALENARKRPASAMSNNSPSNYLTKNIGRELMELKCKKLRAELDLLQKDSYKRDLEILQLERSLGLPSSHITRKFYKNFATSSHGGRNDLR